eukprot:283513_1
MRTSESDATTASTISNENIHTTIDTGTVELRTKSVNKPLQSCVYARMHFAIRQRDAFRREILMFDGVGLYLMHHCPQMQCLNMASNLEITFAIYSWALLVILCCLVALRFINLFWKTECFGYG